MQIQQIPGCEALTSLPTLDPTKIESAEELALLYAVAKTIVERATEWQKRLRDAVLTTDEEGVEMPGLKVTQVVRHQLDKAKNSEAIIRLRKIGVDDLDILLSCNISIPSLTAQCKDKEVGGDMIKSTLRDLMIEQKSTQVRVSSELVDMIRKTPAIEDREQKQLNEKG